jgi:hypothetical protein
MQATMGCLKDGTPFRRFAPPLPLDDQWTLPNDPGALEVRDRWVNLRSSLMQTGQLEVAVQKLLRFWFEHGLLPRPIEDEGSDHVALLLKAGIDTAMAARSKTNIDVRESFIPEASRRQAAELLARPIRQEGEITPMEIGHLHRVTCPFTELIDKDGKTVDRFKGQNEGTFRSKPIYVMGTDWVMKEGAPAKQIVPELLKIIEANRAMRQKGVLAIVRAAWVLYAFSVVHPFYDGNGRIARMLASMVLIRGGRLPLIMPPRVHRAFFDTMADARNGRPQMLLRLMAECQIALMESALVALG